MKQLDSTRTETGPVPSPEPPSGPAADDPRVIAALEEYASALRQGHRPRRQEFLARHPGLGSALSECLDGLDIVHSAACELDSEASGLAADPLSAALGELGDFRLLGEIGRGGMGVVYEAEQISLGRRVALKVLPFAATLDGRQLQRFHNEARAAACLHHANIVPVHGVGCERGVHYYAMQLIEGQSLETLLQEMRPLGSHHAPRDDETSTAENHHAERDGYLGNPETVREPRAQASTLPSPREGVPYFRRIAELMIQAAEALEHAHQSGVVHRDIKPGNLMLDGRGDLWVTDFGLAQFNNDARLTLTGDLVGTLRYMSPEQALAKRVIVDHRTDIYSLGATLYELVTLKPAFSGQDRQELLRQLAFEEPLAPRRLNRTIPVELETIMAKAMEKNPAERYATAKEMADDLKRYLNDEPTLARRPSLWQRGRKWARRHVAAVRAAAIAAVLVLVAMGGMAGAWVNDHASRLAETEHSIGALMKEADQLQTERKMPEALAKVKQAQAILASGVVTPLTKQNVTERLVDLQMVAELEDIRMASAVEVKVADTGISFDMERRPQRYAQAFRNYGVDAEKLEPQETASRIRARSVAVELAIALDDWAIALRRTKPADDTGWKSLLAAARAADQDPWRNQLRTFLEQKNVKDLKVLAEKIKVGDLPPNSLLVIADALRANGDMGEAIRLLQAAQQLYPSDFWINLELGLDYINAQPPNYEEAVRFNSAAVAVRPMADGARNNLALALYRLGRYEEASAIQQRIIRFNPKVWVINGNLARTLFAQGKVFEALDEFLEAVRHHPSDNYDSAAIHPLGAALSKKGKLDDMIADAFVKANDKSLAKALDPQGERFPLLFQGLAWAIAMDGRAGATEKDRKAIEVLRKGSDLYPIARGLHRYLAWMLVSCADPNLRDPKMAVIAGNRAVESEPGNTGAWNALGMAHVRSGDYETAINEINKAIALNKEGFHPLHGFFLAMAHKHLGDIENAGKWYAKSVEKIGAQKSRLRTEVEELLGIKDTEALKLLEETLALRKTKPIPGSTAPAGAT